MRTLLLSSVSKLDRRLKETRHTPVTGTVNTPEDINYKIRCDVIYCNKQLYLTVYQVQLLDLQYLLKNVKVYHIILLNELASKDLCIRTRHLSEAPSLSYAAKSQP